MSNEEALACDIATWEKLCRYEMARITEFLNIKGKDVASLMKALQVTPWLQNNRYQVELEGQSRAMLTVSYCATLSALEREGEGREKQICQMVEPIMLKSYASFFNPGIEITCLKSPPRASRCGICCQWEFSQIKQDE